MDKFKEYGKIGIVTHLTISWTLFACTYLIIRNSNQTDKIIKFLKLQNKVPKTASSFVLSGIIYKATMPGRIALSLLAIPIVIKTFNLEVGKVENEEEQKKVDEIV